MSSLSEKRLYGQTRPETHAYVGSGLGITRVETAGGQVGRFSLEERCSARDIAGANGEIAVATDEAVLLSTSEGFAESGFGPATAVGYDADGLLAAGDGRVARYADGEWTTVGDVADVSAIDGGLVGADGGVYALPDCTRLGLAGVTDVTRGYAATAEGLYARADDDWTEVRSGEHAVVASDGRRVHAAADTLVELAEGTWRPCDLPVRERVVDVTYGEATYAVTEDGTFLVETADDATADGRGGWRGRSLGVPGVVGVAVA
jgi:hypothetical protein